MWYCGVLYESSWLAFAGNKFIALLGLSLRDFLGPIFDSFVYDDDVYTAGSTLKGKTKKKKKMGFIFAIKAADVNFTWKCLACFQYRRDVSDVFFQMIFYTKKTTSFETSSSFWQLADDIAGRAQLLTFFFVVGRKLGTLHAANLPAPPPLVHLIFLPFSLLFQLPKVWARGNIKPLGEVLAIDPDVSNIDQQPSNTDI